MELDYTLDELITEALSLGYSLEQIAEDLMNQPLNHMELITETVRRTYMMRSGVRMTRQKIGRPNPAKSQKAKRTAMKFRSKRKMAARRFARSAKGKRMRRILTQARKQKRRPQRGGPITARRRR
jgi:hypothetical protein